MINSTRPQLGIIRGDVPTIPPHTVLRNFGRLGLNISQLKTGSAILKNKILKNAIVVFNDPERCILAKDEGIVDILNDIILNVDNTETKCLALKALVVFASHDMTRAYICQKSVFENSTIHILEHFMKDIYKDDQIRSKILQLFMIIASDKEGAQFLVTHGLLKYIIEYIPCLQQHYSVNHLDMVISDIVKKENLVETKRKFQQEAVCQKKMEQQKRFEEALKKKEAYLNKELGDQTCNVEDYLEQGQKDTSKPKAEENTIKISNRCSEIVTKSEQNPLYIDGQYGYVLYYKVPQSKQCCSATFIPIYGAYGYVFMAEKPQPKLLFIDGFYGYVTTFKAKNTKPSGYPFIDGAYGFVLTFERKSVKPKMRYSVIKKPATRWVYECDEKPKSKYLIGGQRQWIYMEESKAEDSRDESIEKYTNACETTLNTTSPPINNENALVSQTPKPVLVPTEMESPSNGSDIYEVPNDRIGERILQGSLHNIRNNESFENQCNTYATLIQLLCLLSTNYQPAKEIISNIDVRGINLLLCHALYRPEMEKNLLNITSLKKQPKLLSQIAHQPDAKSQSGSVKCLCNTSRSSNHRSQPVQKSIPDRDSLYVQGTMALPTTSKVQKETIKKDVDINLIGSRQRYLENALHLINACCEDTLFRQRIFIQEPSFCLQLEILLSVLLSSSIGQAIVPRHTQPNIKCRQHVHHLPKTGGYQLIDNLHPDTIPSPQDLGAQELLKHRYVIEKDSSLVALHDSYKSTLFSSPHSIPSPPPCTYTKIRRLILKIIASIFTTQDAKITTSLPHVIAAACLLEQDPANLQMALHTLLVITSFPSTRATLKSILYNQLEEAYKYLQVKAIEAADPKEQTIQLQIADQTKQILKALSTVKPQFVSDRH